MVFSERLAASDAPNTYRRCPVLWDRNFVLRGCFSARPALRSTCSHSAALSATAAPLSPSACSPQACCASRRRRRVSASAAATFPRRAARNTRTAIPQMLPSHPFSHEDPSAGPKVFISLYTACADRASYTLGLSGEGGQARCEQVVRRRVSQSHGCTR